MELAESIRQFGVLQPLLVQKKGKYYGNNSGREKMESCKDSRIKKGSRYT